MTLPTKEQYPDAMEDLFRPNRISGAIHNICAAANKSFQADIDFSGRDIVRDDGSKSVGCVRVCNLTLEVNGVCRETVVGEGHANATARQAAWLHALARLHANGSLRALLATRSQPKSKPEAEAPNPTTDTSVQDGHHSQTRLTLPTRQDYPHAPKALFDPVRVAAAVTNQCAKMKVPMHTDVDTSVKRVSKSDVHVCTLKLELSPDLFQDTKVGEGSSKQAARQAAWVQIVAEMHKNGALKELFPDRDVKPALNRNAEPDYVDEDGTQVEPAKLDEKTINEQKDAKTEIYNYVAGLGHVPRFDVRIVKPRAARPSFRRAPQQKAKPVIRVTIRVPELRLEAIGAGHDLRTAETAAAVAFKRTAEEQHNVGAHSPGTGPLSQVGMLNTDTAKDFFVFLRDSRPRLSVEVENELGQEAGNSRSTARLTVDGEPTGQPVTMPSKKQAASIAYLTAAIAITQAEPELLTQFQQRLRKDKGKVLQPISAIDFPVDGQTLQIMRNALVEARQAGLPDAREDLSAAEDTLATDSSRRRRRMLVLSEIEAASKSLKERQRAFDEDPSLEELRSKKESLPMNKYRKQVLDMVGSSQYSIVVGATGSGKTTQVPQILLEEQIASDNGGACNIICTQPRRIAATSVAQRVAVERNEKLQRSVGYHVRFDVKLPQPGGSITYCTTGILLEQLKHDPDILDSVSHLVVDEVHERDLNIDFLMIVIKKALHARQAAGKNVPKVVLMSATLDTDLFASYFAHAGEDGKRTLCPSLSVPGRTFPVKDKYLGDLMHDLLQSHGPELGGVLKMDLASEDYLKSETAFSARHNHAVAAASRDTIIDWKRERQPQLESDDDSSAQQEKEEARVPTALLAATIAHICKTTEDGAILAFVPGIEEILRTQRHLLDRNSFFGLNFHDSAKFKVCLLHSTIPKEEQSQIFDPVPRGCRKIILSTNIAETSVTVTDVKYVVDTGKLRETRYDQIRRITKLQCVWESKSNSKQRAGRAGRVQDGYYYALFSQERHQSLRAVGLPELLRSDLQETCLSIKAQNYNEPVETFLAQAIEPPAPRAIQAALSNLQAVEAFTEDEKLTDLGRLLSKLPIHPALGKMIVLGVIFRCLDPMLVLGAAAEERSLFVSPIGRDARAGATGSRRSYADREPSDHLATLQAFKEVRMLRDQYGMGAAFDRARENYIHMGAFRTIDQTAKQVVDILSTAGVVTDPLEGRHRPNEYGPTTLNENSGNTALIQCLLLAGVYPNLGAKTTSRGLTYRTVNEQNVMMHPSSLNAESKVKVTHSYGTLFAYSALARSNDGSSLFMRDSTLVTPLMSALFGGKLHMSRYNRLEMDEWLPFFVQASDRQFATKLILEFRKALDRVLNSAFRSLAGLDGGQRKHFVDDPMREKFARRVVQVLDQSAGGNEEYLWPGEDE